MDKGTPAQYKNWPSKTKRGAAAALVVLAEANHPAHPNVHHTHPLETRP